MNVAEKPTSTDAGTETCLARSVVDTLAREPGLEAVTIDPVHEKISVATLGRADVETLTRRVTEKIQLARESRVCSLLEGAGECHVCEMPLTRDERRNIVIRREGDSTTIARATCPTAPVFWRWRDLPLPKVVPRDVEFLENAEDIDKHINEWKAQMAAAVLW